MRPPPYRPALAREGLGYLNAGAAYDANHELAISFGGQGSAGDMNNLFAYDAYANALYRLDAANPPSPRDGMGLCYDTKNDCLVVFGSQYDNDERTWTYRYADSRWEGHDLTPHPPGKKLGTYATIPRLAYDSRNGACLGLVWDTNTGEHQTWAFDRAARQWTKLNPPAEPEPSMSRSRNLSYDAEHNVFILETSSKEGRGTSPQIWTYRYKNAPPEPRPVPPTNVQLLTDTGKATLTWSASQSPTKEHRVFRAKAELPWQVQFEQIATVSGNRFEDTGLAAGSRSRQNKDGQRPSHERGPKKRISAQRKSHAKHSLLLAGHPDRGDCSGS